MEKPRYVDEVEAVRFYQNSGKTDASKEARDRFLAKITKKRTYFPDRYKVYLPVMIAETSCEYYPS